MIQETIQTIAQRTGFSVSTVSRVLNGKADQYRIAKTTQAKIEAEASRCHYAPSMVARALRTKSTQTIGLILPTISNPFFWELAGIISKRAKEKGFVVLLMDSADDPELEMEGLLALRSHNVDGILMIPAMDRPEIIAEVAAEVPLVLLDRYYTQGSLPYVSSENRLGAYRGTQFLLQKGHRKIAFVQGRPQIITSSERLKGYREAMQEVPDAVETIFGEAFSVDCGYCAVKTLLEGDPTKMPTAIFAGNNTILFGILKALKEFRALSPAKFELVCFDNPDYMQFFPFVHRLGQNIQLMGEKALEMLILRIAAKKKQQAVDIPSLLLPVDSSWQKD